ncbi:LysM domain protein [Croceitalea dokdonensis DOKDO 023]|uniref:LysM domain protein n=1 Tax=Croceitalea dokdonensis DOKDO 023 TaxID=1300341 RepID=A0A0P7ANV3_9FLAO|nr:hypothetical protein [Croceitalea dokdonensis]KPM33697.1 LysM domain protein [Croceitalea dokdonensis DOKDO 023]
MKRWIGFLLHLAIVIIFASFGTYSISTKVLSGLPEILRTEANSKHRVPLKEDLTKEKALSRTIFLGDTFVGFKEAIGFKESQGNYTSVNTLGYLGKYQFGINTLNLMGVYSSSEFLQSPLLQERIFEMNLSRNKWILRRDIKRFVGKRINHVVISESGILAAAHLAGAGNVKKYLRSYGHSDFSDAYGTSIANYIQTFSGYDTSCVSAVKNPSI